MSNCDTDEIQLLLSQFNNICLESEAKMAQPNNDTNYQLIRLYLDSIPQYDGNPHTLNIFINNCEYFLNTFASNNMVQNECFLRIILGKLKGRALILIGSRIELKTWDEIKAVLLLSFSDQRNIDCLIQDLLALKPSKNETPYNFGMRCQDARSLIISKLNSLAMTNEEKMIRLKSYDDLALKTFIRGLSGQIQNNVRLRNPENLETAMSLVIEEENFLYSTQRTNTLNTQTNYRPPQRFTPMKQNYPQQNSQNSQNFNNHTPNFQQFKPNPMSQNFNNFPRNQNNFTGHQRPQFFSRPSNQSGFTNQSNNHRNFPNPQNSLRFNQNSKPEPMDTSSGNSRIKPKQNWRSNEVFLHNVQQPSYEDSYQEPQYYPENVEYDAFDYDAEQNNHESHIPDYSADNAVLHCASHIEHDTSCQSHTNFQFNPHSQNPT